MPKGKRKRTVEETKDLEYVRLSELAELNGVRYSTVKFYTLAGLLPYQQQGTRLAKYYPRVEASARLKKIAKLKEKRLSIEEIRNSLRLKPATSPLLHA